MTTIPSEIGAERPSIPHSIVKKLSLCKKRRIDFRIDKMKMKKIKILLLRWQRCPLHCFISWYVIRSSLSEQIQEVEFPFSKERDFPSWWVFVETHFSLWNKIYFKNASGIKICLVLLSASNNYVGLLHSYHSIVYSWSSLLQFLSKSDSFCSFTNKMYCAMQKPFF